jgi:hypothetical protein
VDEGSLQQVTFSMHKCLYVRDWQLIILISSLGTLLNKRDNSVFYALAHVHAYVVDS